MPRVIIAFFAAPALVSLAYGWGAFVALPLALICAVLFGGPTFMLCRKRGWIDWWHCVVGGVLCATPIIILFVFSVNSGYIDRNGPIVSLMLAASGAVAGLLFWWIGLFRNRHFNNPSSSSLWTMLMLIPVVGVSIAYGNELTVKPMLVRIVEVTKEPERTGDLAEVTVRLSSGEVVKGDLPSVFRKSAVTGACFSAVTRRSILLTKKLYFLQNAVTDSRCPKSEETGNPEFRDRIDSSTRTTLALRIESAQQPKAKVAE